MIQKPRMMAMHAAVYMAACLAIFLVVYTSSTRMVALYAAVPMVYTRMMALCAGVYMASWQCM